MAKAKKKAAKKRSSKKAANGKVETPPEPPKQEAGDPRLLEFVGQLAGGVERGDIVGMVVIPVDRNGQAGQLMLRGVTPPHSLALSAIALPAELLNQATAAAQRHQTMQQALSEAKAQGLLQEKPS